MGCGLPCKFLAPICLYNRKQQNRISYLNRIRNVETAKRSGRPCCFIRSRVANPTNLNEQLLLTSLADLFDSSNVLDYFKCD